MGRRPLICLPRKAQISDFNSNARDTKGTVVKPVARESVEDKAAPSTSSAGSNMSLEAQIEPAIASSSATVPERREILTTTGSIIEALEGGSDDPGCRVVENVRIEAVLGSSTVSSNAFHGALVSCAHVRPRRNLPGAKVTDAQEAVERVAPSTFEHWKTVFPHLRPKIFAKQILETLDARHRFDFSEGKLLRRALVSLGVPESDDFLEQTTPLRLLCKKVLLVSEKEFRDHILRIAPPPQQKVCKEAPAPRPSYRLARGQYDRTKFVSNDSASEWSLFGAPSSRESAARRAEYEKVCHIPAPICRCGNKASMWFSKRHFRHFWTCSRRLGGVSCGFFEQAETHGAGSAFENAFNSDTTAQGRRRSQFAPAISMASNQPYTPLLSDGRKRAEPETIPARAIMERNAKRARLNPCVGADMERDLSALRATEAKLQSVKRAAQGAEHEKRPACYCTVESRQPVRKCFLRSKETFAYCCGRGRKAEGGCGFLKILSEPEHCKG